MFGVSGGVRESVVSKLDEVQVQRNLDGFYYIIEESTAVLYILLLYRMIGVCVCVSGDMMEERKNNRFITTKGYLDIDTWIHTYSSIVGHDHRTT